MRSDPGQQTPRARAKSITADISAAADEIDAGRELPATLVAKMKALGLFRLLAPRSVGGEEADWLDYLHVVCAVAQADASVGWCLNQAAVFATACARAPEGLAQEVWGDPDTVVANGPPHGPVTATPTAGGYRLTGEWMFSSGCRHANWMAALAAGGGQEARLCFLRRDEVEFLDVWRVRGLRGTGSFSFRTRGVFVREARTMPLAAPPREPGPLYVIPQDLLFACGFGCVALGNARAGLDATIALCADKRPRFARRPLSDEPVVQQRLGEAEATWRAAKAYLFQAAGDVWGSVGRHGAISLAERIALRMAGTHAIRQSAAVVDVAYNLSGATSIFQERAIQRRFQDAHVITQQVQGRESHFQTAGQHLLGMAPHGMI